MRDYRKEYWQGKIARQIAIDYEKYGREHKLYTKTTKLLLDFLGLKIYKKIIDLGCGTGFSSELIAKKFRNLKKLYCIDSSKEMLCIAKTKFTRNRRLIFIFSKAENISKIDDKVDLVLSNASFQYFEPNKALNEIKNVLKNNGLFVFNIWPVWYKEMRQSKEFINFFKLFYKNMNEIANQQGYKSEFNYKFELGNTYGFLSLRILKKLFKKHSFKLIKYEEIPIDRSIQDYLDFLSMPSISKHRLPNVPIENRKRIFKKAMSLTTSKINYKSISHKWPFFLVKKI